MLTNAVRYLDPADSLAAEVLDAARHLVPLGSPQLKPHNGQAYLASPADMAAIAERVAAAMSKPGKQTSSRPPPSSPHDAPWTRPVTWASAPTTCPRRTATRQRPSTTSATAASTRSCTAATAPPPTETRASAE